MLDETLLKDDKFWLIWHFKMSLGNTDPVVLAVRDE